MEHDLTVAVAQLTEAPESHDEALAMVGEQIAKAHGADLLVLPELALCGYGDPTRIRRLATPLDGPFIDQLRALARQARLGLIVGHAERAGGQMFNTALAIGAEGEIRGAYRKVNLWGPYEKDLFAPGRPSEVLPWGAQHLGFLICYDLEFPEAARDLVLRGADTLIVISATGSSYGVVPHCLVPARGYETGCHVVYANWAGSHDGFAFVGGSRLTGPDGALLAAAADGSTVIRATLDRAALQRWRDAHPYIAERRSDLYRLQ